MAMAVDRTLDLDRCKRPPYSVSLHQTSEQKRSGRKLLLKWNLVRKKTNVQIFLVKYEYNNS